MLSKAPAGRRGFKKERILRVLLSERDEMTKYRLSKEAGVSEPWCREYTSRLQKMGIIKDTTVLDHERLYTEWEGIHVASNSIKLSLQDPLELVRHTELSYALTTYMAENLYQGYLFPSMIDLYIVERERGKWLNIIEKKGMIGGGNTRIRITDEHVLYGMRTLNGLNMVSVPQLILDLRLEGGHCREAALKLMGRYHGVG